MVHKDILHPDWLFEVSWEVCNKVGGINTVIATKAPAMRVRLRDNIVMIGPWLSEQEASIGGFVEDSNIFPDWLDNLRQTNLKVRIGRWDIPGHPIVVLIDFKDFFERKDDILTQLWTKFRVDSITGGWDYIEPVIFGYVAGMVIENFYHYHISEHQFSIAQFHEWMTGAGLLYLKDRLPQIGTAFTTHATVLGRSIAGNNYPLYDELEKYEPEILAKQFNVVAKHSMEQKSAYHADVFTTVSEITARECEHFLAKTPDIITPNGFDASFIPEENFESRRTVARKRLMDVAEAILNQPVSDDDLLMVKSGRYEFRNKGVDVFLDALHKLNSSDALQRQIVVFITIPAGINGPVQEVLDRIGRPDFKNPLSNQYLTHHLTNYHDDPIITRIKNNNLFNRVTDKVKVIFAPVYLDGKDGVINMNYYDLLVGFDFSAFPSYYEPWGYTPLESLASKIPTITTNLAGFGNWVSNSLPGYLNDGIYVVDRNDINQDQCSAEIARIILEYSELNSVEIKRLRKRAHELAEKSNWLDFSDNYINAYNKALQKVLGRQYMYGEKRSRPQPVKMQTIEPNREQGPSWRKLFVQPKVPVKFAVLHKLAFNLWTNWDYDAMEVFEMLDPEGWKRFKNNPTAILESVSYERLMELEKNNEFCQKLDKVVSRFKAYMERRANPDPPRIAYFCMEYGLDALIKLYSGGLGILAGDYLKEASDARTNMVAVGLLYRFGYFKQQLSAEGEQIAVYKPQKFSYLPIQPVKDANDVWLTISIDMPGAALFAKVWKLEVGSVPLYLLDTDIEQNKPEDRVITHQLYGGDWDNRLKQEILLGLGGIRLLNTLGIEPDIYHCNEGHAALTGIERLKNLVTEKGLEYNEAVELIRASSLFTTHTPVPAGHDAFTEEEMLRYFNHYPEYLRIDWNDFMALGRSHPLNANEKFSMSFLAASLSARINGVSRIHGRVSKDIFQPLYPGYFSEEVNVDYVTNGVHYSTWTSHRWQKLYKETFDERFYEHQNIADYWKQIYQVPDEQVWEIRKQMKAQLIDWLKIYLTRKLDQSHQSPKMLMRLMNNLDSNALMIGFARRFATYKRANLLFNDLERLARLAEDPVIFFFSGKAHPKDIPGQELIKRIVEVANREEFIGRVIFIEDYDMNVAKYLVQGVDVWLNTPTRPMEASGTSGMKATMNGVLNLSVLDGWWAEGYKDGTGWALPEENHYKYVAFQDEFDSETIYSLLDKEVKPLFYDRNEKGVPVKWVQRIKKTIAEIAPEFTTTRMLSQYQSKFYGPMHKRYLQLASQNYKMAGEIADWKMKIRENWASIKVESMDVFDSVNQSLGMGDPFTAKVVLQTGAIKSSDIGVEVVFIRKYQSDEVTEIVSVEELPLKETNGQKATYTGSVTTNKSGVYEFSFRIFPKNNLLESRMELPLVKWI